MESLRTVRHDFAVGFCEINLNMTIHNSSDSVTSVHVKTFDSAAHINSSIAGAPVTAANEAGWHNLSPQDDDAKVTSEILGNSVGKSLSPVSISPFIWSASTSTHVKLEPLSSAEVSLQICVFSPGTYDVSNYALHWNVEKPHDKEYGLREMSGTCQGHSYYISVLQKD